MPQEVPRLTASAEVWRAGSGQEAEGRAGLGALTLGRTDPTASAGTLTGRDSSPFLSIVKI